MSDGSLGSFRLRSLLVLALCVAVLPSAVGCKRRHSHDAAAPAGAGLLEFKFEADPALANDPKVAKFPNTAPPGYQWYTEGPGSEVGKGTPVLLPDANVLSPADVWYANLGWTKDGGYEVFLVLTPAGVERTAEIIGANEGRRFYVLLKGRILYSDLLQYHTPRDFARVHGPLAEPDALAIVGGLDRRGQFSGDMAAPVTLPVASAPAEAGAPEPAVASAPAAYAAPAAAAEPAATPRHAVRPERADPDRR